MIANGVFKVKMADQSEVARALVRLNHYSIVLRKPSDSSTQLVSSVSTKPSGRILCWKNPPERKLTATLAPTIFSTASTSGKFKKEEALMIDK